jgi:hypothetical protein
MPATFSLLGLKPDELKRAFECSPWTLEVRGITYRPLGVSVRLDYRRPVAVVEVSADETYLIDEEAVLLPQEGLDRDLSSFARESLLVTIKGEGLAGPHDPKPGIMWKPRAGTTDLAPGNGRIPAAAKLASFLQRKLQTTDSTVYPGLSLRQINPMDEDKAYRGLFLWNREDKTYVLWGEAPGEEKQGELAAEEKWARISVWSRSETRRTLPDGRYWKIAGPGLVPDGTERRPPASTRVIKPPHDREAILTKDPG